MPAFGRGGAGNIEALNATKTSNATNEKISADLERNQQEAEDYAGTAHPALHNQEYAHTGRGGAGNYYSPRELKATGKFEGADTSHVLGDGTPAPKSDHEKAKEATVIRYGRGGMGNFFGGDEDAANKLREKQEEEARKQEELKQQIEKGVDGVLSRPEKACLPGGEPF